MYFLFWSHLQNDQLNLFRSNDIMCRMLVAAGKFSMPLLLKDSSLIAEDKNEKHENNQSDEEVSTE